MDGAAINDHNLVYNLLGNGDHPESDNTRALASHISDVVHRAKRREEGGNVILRETRWFSTLDGESDSSIGSEEDKGQSSIKT